jgi:hypothetical protein
MRRFRKILLITTALFFAGLGFILYKAFWSPENTKQVFYPMSQQEKGLLHSGDIILRRGYGMFSDGIVEVQNSPAAVSHCAMIVGEPGKWRVAHALSSSVAAIDGAQEQSLQRFLNESVPNSIIVKRFRCQDDTIARIVDRVSYYTRIHKPFDHNFDKVDTTRFYCTELFQHCFKDVLGRDIFLGQLDSNTTGIYDLSTFQDTSLFETIIDHHTH